MIVTRKAAESTSARRDPLDRQTPTGLLLAGMGGPDGPDSVAPFLRNLFADPAVLPMPRLVARLVGFLIVRRRIDKVRARYEAIGCGGGSPQLGWARAQCAELARLMADQGIAVDAVPAMRYWHPFADEAIEGLLGRGARQFAVVPAYPQYAGATTGSALRAVRKALARRAPDAALHEITHWHRLTGYVDALANRAAPVLQRWAGRGRDPAGCALLCVAHSLPERFLIEGDPYVDQTRATVAELKERLRILMVRHADWWERLPGGERPLLAFQSKVGPVKWVGPSVKDEVLRLAEAGCRSLIVLPVSFTCEHIETLHELDIELAAKARGAGIEEFVRCEALNVDRGWLESLAGFLVRNLFAPARREAVEACR